MKTIIPAAGRLERASTAGAWLDGFVAATASLLTSLGRWRQVSGQRRALGELTDHLLKDIGLTRADVDRELGKPFWRE